MTTCPVNGRLIAACVLVALGVACDHPKNISNIVGPTTLAVSSVLPNVGASGEAVAVKISGSGFLAGASVRFGGQSAAVTAVSATQLSVTTPVSEAGSVDVVVTNPDGQESRFKGGFTFLEFAVTNLSRREGMPFEFDTISGTGFRSGVRVRFGDAEANVFRSDLREIQLFTPLHAAGTVDVTVTNPDGRTVTLAAAFTYQPITLSVSANPVAAGGALRVTWATSRLFSDFDPDFIGLYRAGAIDDRRVSLWEVEVDAPTGTISLTAPAEPGDYEFRYLLLGAHVLGTTPVSVVGPGTQRR